MHKIVEEFELWSTVLINLFIILTAIPIAISRFLRRKITVVTLIDMFVLVFPLLFGLPILFSGLGEVVLVGPQDRGSFVFGAIAFTLGGAIVIRAVIKLNRYIKTLPETDETT